jgi:SAM-dependent methyltransferase
MATSSRNQEADYLRTVQYRDSSNLSAREQLNAQFRTNPQDWFPWVFDHLPALDQANVLELGSGPGWLWHHNCDRIPAGWTITLSDLSPGMVAEVEAMLGHVRPFTFREIDAQAIPFGDDTFDLVIANHMLFHLPDIPAGIGEIRRVLKPHGQCFATTVGSGHMREMFELGHRFAPDVTVWREREAGFLVPFTPETGHEHLNPFFDTVRLHHHEDALVATEVEPLVAYMLSGAARDALGADREEQFSAFIAQEMAATGAIVITKQTGVFQAWNA